MFQQEIKKREVLNLKIEYVKHLICFILCFCFIFSLCSVNSFASNSNGNMDFYASSADLSCYYYDEDNQNVITLSPVTTVFDWKDREAFRIRIPQADGSLDYTGPVRFVESFTLPNLHSNHEYTLDFWYAFNTASYGALTVLLEVLDGNQNLINTPQILYYSPDNIQSDTWTRCNISFKPDLSSVQSGYSCRLVFQFTQVHNGSPWTIHISNYIYFNDNDNDNVSGVLQSFYLDCVTELLNIQKYIVLFNYDMVTRFDTLLSRFDISLSSFLSSLQIEFTNLKSNLNTNFSSLISSLDIHFNNLDSKLTSIWNSISNFNLDFINLMKKLQSSLDNEFEYINNFLEENFGYDSGSDDIMSEGQTSVDDLNNGASEADEAVPSINESDLNSALNQEGITSFINDLTASFQFFNMIYENVVSALNIEALIFFCLSFGIAIYIIGRRLGVG